MFCFRADPDLEPFNARWSKDKASKGRKTRRSLEAASATTSLPYSDSGAAALTISGSDSSEVEDFTPAEIVTPVKHGKPMGETKFILVKRTEDKIVYRAVLSSDEDEEKGEKSKMKEYKSTGTQVDVQLRPELIKLRKENAEMKMQLDLFHGLTETRSGSHQFEYLTDTPQKFKFYTGLTREQFDLVFRFLEPDVFDLTMWGANPDKRRKIRPRKHDLEFQLGLTLLRIRRGYNLHDMAYQFKMSRATIGDMFVTWVQLLYKKFGEMKDDMFAPQSHHHPLPPAFKNSLLRKVRVVIDCTEFPIESSRDYRQQGNLYSQYKSRTTAKVLTGVAPGGAMMFVSDAYEGSISDREIVIKSGFLDKIEEGDHILADKGFTIHDLLAKKGARIVIPPFRERGQQQLTAEQNAMTKIVARARIHVERYNERIKNFELLNQKIHSSLIPLLSQIVFIVCVLVNFQEPLAAIK